ncbi:unnamed protein product [Heterobilharzia americana]|nr:unnamed protein product [Heterobilharzia americana]
MATNSLSVEDNKTITVSSPPLDLTNEDQMITNFGSRDAAESGCLKKTSKEDPLLNENNCCCSDGSNKEPETFSTSFANSKNTPLCIDISASELNIIPSADQSISHWRRLKKRSSDLTTAQTKNSSTSSTPGFQITSIITTAMNCEANSILTTSTRTNNACHTTGYDNAEMSNSGLELKSSCMYSKFSSSTSSIVPLASSSRLVNPEKFGPTNPKWISSSSTGTPIASALTTAMNMQQRFKKVRQFCCMARINCYTIRFSVN